MDVAIMIGISVVLLLFLVVDLVGNRVGRSFPRHKLTHHKH